MTGAVNVAIIGAGPYGLSIAAHLAASQIEYRIFGTPMHTWKTCMPEGMFLRSEGFATNLSHPSGDLTLAKFCAHQNRSVGEWAEPIPLDVYCDYGEWFIERLGLPVEDSQLERLARSRGGFILNFDGGETLYARRVVLAVGLTHFAYTAEALRCLPSDLLSHSSEPRRFRDWVGRDVTVLGAGQSALETAALLHEHNANVRIVARRSAVNWHPAPAPCERSPIERLRRPVAGLGMGWNCWFAERLPNLFRRLPEWKRVEIVGSTFGPAGAWWLRERVDGRIPVHLGRSLRNAQAHNGRAVLRLNGPEGTEMISTEHVVAATGYRIDLDRLAFLDEDLRRPLRRAATSPALARTFESSVPGLHFVGAASATTFGPVMRFVLGAEFASRTIARSLS
jgi:thioredoxin reductase